MKYILKENLRPSVYGFTGDDYKSEYGLLRGHLLDDMEKDLDQEIICSRTHTEASDETSPKHYQIIESEHSHKMDRTDELH